MEISYRFPVWGVLIFSLFVLFSSCKKDSDSTTTDEFIEFDLDGVKHRFANNPTAIYLPDAAGDHYNASGAVTKHPGYPADNVLAVAFGLVCGSNDMKVGSYQYVASSVDLSSTIVFTVNSGTGETIKTYGDATKSDWSFTFTQFGGKGKLSEGTFSFSSVNARDKDNNLLSSGHVISNGKFKLMVKN